MNQEYKIQSSPSFFGVTKGKENMGLNGLWRDSIYDNLAVIEIAFFSFLL
jgi:hypothetical protein